MTRNNSATLLNVMGFITGAMLYSMLLVMILRRSDPAKTSVANSGSRLSSRSQDFLPFITAILGIVWNLGALAIYGLQDLQVLKPVAILSAMAFSALGFLPAVVVHSVLAGLTETSKKKGARWMIIAAHSVSTTAAALHFYSAIMLHRAPSSDALLLLTFSFAVLIFILIYMTVSRTGWSQAYWIAALSLFAVSALHLSHHEGDQYSWPVELIGHHASLPLAFAILYQDFRFALADIFLKRALTLVVMVALAFGLYISVISPLFSTNDNTDASDPLRVGILLAIWIATALIYPTIRKAVAQFVDKIILRRVDYDSLRADVSHLASTYESPDLILDAVCKVLTPALNARGVHWVKENGSSELIDRLDVEQLDFSDRHSVDQLNRSSEPKGLVANNHLVLPGPRNMSAVVAIPTAEAPNYRLVIEYLSGGRRLLSDDMAMLESVAIIIARHIDALRITHERCEQNLREQEISKLATEAELKALRAQINPHFLFNALTTIGYLIQTAPDRALDTLMRLTGLLRSVLRSVGEFSTLGEEIQLIESYLEIERARFEDRLRITIDVPQDLRSISIPALLIQPLVENAIKHGIAPCKFGGEVLITACKDANSSENFHKTGLLCITVRDTGAGVSEIELSHGRKRGVGISNIEHRLKCYYDSDASMTIESERGTGTTVKLWLPMFSKFTDDKLASAPTFERKRA